MAEKNPGEALLNLNAEEPGSNPDARQLTDRVIKRDKLRIRLLAALAALFWLLAVAGPGLVILVYFKALYPKLNSYVDGRRAFQEDGGAVWLWIGSVVAGIMLACLIALLLAAVCTVLLILVSRRATLRQINANLLGISEQVLHLRQALASQSTQPPSMD